MLYLLFFKIGIFAFGGGYAVIPLIQKYIVEDHALIGMRELIDLISISQMTPGPIAINCATFVGQKVNSFLGALMATAGFVSFQFVLMMFLGYFLFTKKRKFKTLDSMLNGIKAGVVSLIFITSIDLLKASVFPNGYEFKNINLAALITFFVSLMLYRKRIGLFKLIGLSAGIGIIINLF